MASADDCDVLVQGVPERRAGVGDVFERREKEVNSTPRAGYFVAEPTGGAECEGINDEQNK